MKKMKKLSTLILATVFSSFVLSCSSDDSGSDGGAIAAHGTISAKINGTNFTSTQMATMATKVNVSGTAHVITVTGTQMDMNAGGTSKTLTLVMNVPDLEPRSYDVGGDNLVTITASYVEVNTATFESTAYAAPYEGGELAGTITITEITDTNIKGNFSFKVKNQNDQNDAKQITDGAFNVDFSSTTP